MNADEYDKLAGRLQDQLNQKGTLIEFEVRDLASYTFGDRHPLDPITRSHFSIDWRIPFEHRALTGSYLFPVEFVVDTLDANIAEIIIDTIMLQITRAITHPDEVSKARIAFT